MPRKGNPIYPIRMHHADGANTLLILDRMRMLIPAPHNLYYFKTLLFPNCFLGILVQREIIANASLLVRYFSSELRAKIVIISGTTKLYCSFSQKKA